MSARSAEVVLEARCKVNLGLAVLARRGDGYHQIETIMARLGLADTLTLRLVSGEPGSVSLQTSVDFDLGPGAADALGVAGLPADKDDNLVVRAAKAYLEAWKASTTAPAPALALALHKRVPVAAGLGGGSSDAAATLLGLQRLLPVTGAGDSAKDAAGNTGAEAIDIMKIAAALGSDVPFFAAELPAALARGRGERLDPLTLPPAWLLLAKPPVAISAAAAYAELLGFTPRLKPQALLEALADGREPGWKNALQPGVMRSWPQVRELLTSLRAAGLRGCLMSGSGATCFGIAADEDQAHAVAESLAAADPRLWLSVARLE